MKTRKKTSKPTKPFRVGIYQLGFIWAELWVDPNSRSGSFDYMPDQFGPAKEKPHARITVGAEDKLWAVWGILTHEAGEGILCDLGARTIPSGSFVNCSTDCYSFHFDHLVFTEFSARLGNFLCECRKDFEQAWRKCR